MARNPTTWANNDVKVPTVFTSVPKTSIAWNAPAPKTPTNYVGVSKNKDSWGPHTPSPQTYFYNDQFIKYNDVNVEYNYLLNNNTDNQRLVSRWSQVV